MAALTQQIIDIVENVNIDADVKQDFYIKWLEFDDPDVSAEHQKNLVNTILSNMLTNERVKQANRERLLEENDDTVRNLYGYDDVSADPLDIIMAEELEDEILASLSDLEKDIYARVLGNGVPYKDVATELDMSEEAVRKHVSRIKRKFNG